MGTAVGGTFHRLICLEARARAKMDPSWSLDWMMIDWTAASDLKNCEKDWESRNRFELHHVVSGSFEIGFHIPSLPTDNKKTNLRSSTISIELWNRMCMWLNKAASAHSTLCFPSQVTWVNSGWKLIGGSIKVDKLHTQRTREAGSNLICLVQSGSTNFVLKEQR